MEHANDNEEGKVCTNCCVWKPLSEFHKRSDSKDGRRPACASCTAAYNKKYFSDPNVQIRMRDYHSRPEVKARIAKKARERRRTDPEVRRREAIKQRESHARPEAKQRRNELRRERNRTDPAYKAECAARNMVHQCLRLSGQTKQSSTFSSVGYSRDQLMLRIECQFKPGMSWENHGEWHIDHKKPIAAFIKQGITDPRQINMLSNLQPLWARENQTKKDFWPLVAANDNQKREKDAA